MGKRARVDDQDGPVFASNDQIETESRRTRRKTSTKPSAIPSSCTATRVQPSRRVAVSRGRKAPSITESPDPSTDGAYNSLCRSPSPDHSANGDTMTAIHPRLRSFGQVPTDEEPRDDTPPLFSMPTTKMSPLTVPDPSDTAVRALGLTQSAKSDQTDPLTFEREDLVRLREGHYQPPCGRGAPPRADPSKMTMSEAAWTRLEEVGYMSKGRSWTAREGLDERGEPVKPELPYVMLTKLVIASSPRKMLTLNQIYQCMEERWPYAKSLGSTFRNSIRHNLSMNPAFVNVERPKSEGGLGTGKGGYWRVSEDLSASHRGRPKKALPNSESLDGDGDQGIQLQVSEPAGQKSRQRKSRTKVSAVTMSQAAMGPGGYLYSNHYNPYFYGYMAYPPVSAPATYDSNRAPAQQDYRFPLYDYSTRLASHAPSMPYAVGSASGSAAQQPPSLQMRPADPAEGAGRGQPNGYWANQPVSAPALLNTYQSQPAFEHPLHLLAHATQSASQAIQQPHNQQRLLQSRLQVPSQGHCGDSHQTSLSMAEPRNGNWTRNGADAGSSYRAGGVDTGLSSISHHSSRQDTNPSCVGDSGYEPTGHTGQGTLIRSDPVPGSMMTWGTQPAHHRL